MATSPTTGPRRGRSCRRRRRRHVHQGRGRRQRDGRAGRPVRGAHDAHRRSGAWPTASSRASSTSPPRSVADAVELVTHSTTQAVNALLEGDVGPRRRDRPRSPARPRKVKRRTSLATSSSSARQAPARCHPCSSTSPTGWTPTHRAPQLRPGDGRGIGAVCVAEAFAPDDTATSRPSCRSRATAGLPACASTELTGLYGLELRAVTAAINASILPIAVRTAELRRARACATPASTRRDGDARRRRRHRPRRASARRPVRTLYSGPAASVAGALRSRASPTA